jgi:pimeloyl-ACP methyl ester carboxylesterase
MTVAALEAEALGRCLRRGTRGLRRRYMRATTKAVDQAWQLATAADLALPIVEGPRPRSQRLLNSYLERLRGRAEGDGDLSTALARVGGMVDKPARLLRPSVARRVLGRRRVGSPPWPGRAPRTPLRRRTLRVDGLATPLREAGPREASEAAVFVHGVPGSGGDFEPLLAAAGQVGRAVAWDAPGFGHAGKPESFDHSLAGHGEFIGGALDALGVERAHLVLHDFGGGSGLSWAAAEPERVASVTLICAGVLLDYDWHRAARLWRTPLLGEAFMATTTRAGFGASLRRGQARRLPGPFVDRMFEDFDRDTRAAILRIYRSVDDLGELSHGFVTALRPHEIPALTIWGVDDPYLPAALAERQREAFPGAEVHLLDECGHWPFVDRGERVEGLLVEFLARSFTVEAEPAEATPA